MTRKKVKLAYIANDSARKATYKKRKKGLMKKVSELSTLCDIQACAIVYSPYDTQPETWPPTAAGVHQVLSRFRKVPQMEQCKKMVNQEKFLEERIKKAAEQLRKQKRDNDEKMVQNALFECLTGRISLQSLTLGDLDVIARAVDQQIKEVDRRLAEIARKGGRGGGGGAGGSAATNGVNNLSLEGSLQMMTPANGGGMVGAAKEEFVENVNHENLQRQLWFMEMMNSNAQAAAAPPAPMAAVEQQQMVFMGGEMMMMNNNAAAGSGGGGGGGFGEGSSNSNWVGNNNGVINGNNNSNPFWSGNNHFYH